MVNQKKNPKKQANSSAKFTFWMIGLVAVCLLGFIFLGNHSKTQDKPKTTTTQIDYSNEPYLGKKSAPVSIIEFGDYKCPNCKNFSATAIPVIQKELIDTGMAKLYFMNDSFINVDSSRAAQFAESVYQELGNDTFWKFHDLLYKKQKQNDEKVDVLTEKYLSDTLKEVASQADVDKVVKNFEAKKSYAAWKKDMNYADKLGVSGTPTLFVNGKLFTGQTLDDLKNMVDNAAKGK